MRSSGSVWLIHARSNRQRLGSNQYKKDDSRLRISNGGILSLTGDFSRGLEGLEVETVELTDTPGPVDFGEIEIAFDREDEDQVGDF
jgi:hypothetical protein